MRSLAANLRRTEAPPTFAVIGVIGGKVFGAPSALMGRDLAKGGGGRRPTRLL